MNLIYEQKSIKQVKESKIIIALWIIIIALLALGFYLLIKIAISGFFGSEIAFATFGFLLTNSIVAGLVLLTPVILLFGTVASLFVAIKNKKLRLWFILLGLVLLAVSSLTYIDIVLNK